MLFQKVEKRRIITFILKQAQSM